MEEMNSYEVEKNAEGHWRLSVEGKQSICPFAGSYPMQTQVGGFGGFMRIGCTTGCPLAKLHKEHDGEIKYTINCGAEPLILPVKIKTDQQQQSKANGNIITM